MRSTSSALRRRRKPSMPSSEAIAWRSASGLDSRAERDSTDMGVLLRDIGVGRRPSALCQRPATRYEAPEASGRPRRRAVRPAPQVLLAGPNPFERLVVVVEGRYLLVARQHASDALEV